MDIAQKINGEWLIVELATDKLQVARQSTCRNFINLCGNY